MENFKLPTKLEIPTFGKSKSTAQIAMRMPEEVGYMIKYLRDVKDVNISELIRPYVIPVIEKAYSQLKESDKSEPEAS